MVIGVELTDSESPAATAFDFPANDEAASSPLAAKLPRRLRRRLSAEPKVPSTVEEIEAKLKEAYLRRQAKVQRQKDLRQRRSKLTFVHSRVKGMLEHGDLLSRVLARCWRQFVRFRKTTYALAKACEALKINERSVKAMSFEDIASRVESASTLQIFKALLERLEFRLRLSEAFGKTSRVENIDHLLKHVSKQNRRKVPGRHILKKYSALSKRYAKTLGHQPRYPVRIVLCAYMILGHPEAIFSGKGDCEVALAKSAARAIQEFELLVRIILDGPVHSRREEMDSATVSRLCFRSQLEAFDRAWCSYLYDFVVWKVEDAKSLEEELVNTACQLELTLIQCPKMDSANSDGSNHQLEANRKQVEEHLKLIREKLHSMSGTAGIECLDRALVDTRSRFFQAEEHADSFISPESHTASNSSLFSSSEVRSLAEGTGPSFISPPSLGGNAAYSGKQTSSPSLGRKDFDGSSISSAISNENEALVNEILHEHRYDLADKFVNDEHQDDFKAKVKETVEKAFWDALMESMNQDQPDFSWVLKLIKEVRDELCEMSPRSWRQEIMEAIDVEMVTQELGSGVFDMANLRKILEFALGTLRRLSSPSSDDEMRIAHTSLLKELEEISCATDKSNTLFAVSLIKGLQFVLQQIQILKREISRARLRLVEPLIRGPTGVEYLKKAFAERYGPPCDASSCLPLTRIWLSSIHPVVEEEWEEHLISVRTFLTSNTVESSQGIPQVTLRAGGAAPTASRVLHPVFVSSDTEQPECSGEEVDKIVRLGLLKLVSKVEGLTLDELPETLKLNFSRLRRVQSQLQNIIVISTSTLVLRQVLLSGATSSNPLANMEPIISNCIKQLSQLLDSTKDAGISEIIGTISGFLIELIPDPEKHSAINQVMGNLLAKSLQAGNPIFSKVSRAVYLAARGLTLGGCGSKGRQLAENELRRIGASLLTSKLVDCMEVLVNVAAVSRVVHGPWYEVLLKDL